MPKVVDHDVQRRAFARAAIAVIDAVGIEATRLRDIAAKANVTTGAVTHYFESRDAVLAAALEEIVTQILEKGLQARPRPRTRDDIIAFVETFLPIDTAGRREWRVWCAYWGRAIANETLQSLHRDYYRKITAALATVLGEADGAHPGSGDFRSLADAIVAAIDGIGVRATMEPKDWPAKRQRATLRLMLEPLLSANAQPFEDAQTRRR